jgi:hypothetical protein
MSRWSGMPSLTDAYLFLKRSAKTMPSTLAETGIACFLFTLTFLSFIEALSGLLIQPYSIGAAASPLFATLYPSGYPQGLILLLGTVISFVIFLMLFIGRNKGMQIAMVLSAISALSLLASFALHSYPGYWQYIMFALYLSLVPLTQYTMSAEKIV